MSTYLYIYESAGRREIYIGIADSMARVWEAHNAEAEALRERAGSRILQTLEPFISRQDARKAEAIAIYVATRAGQKVLYSDDSSAEDCLEHVELEDIGLVRTIRSGTRSTTVLGPAIKHLPGETIAYEDLRSTAIVRIKPDQIDERPAPFGGLGGAQFATRAERWWPLTSAS